MTSFPDPLSAVRQSQWEAQLDIFSRLSSRALDSTEQLIALNLRTSRASMEQAAGTIRRMLDANEPRDLLAVGSAAQGQWHQMFAYGRELLGIASGLRAQWSAVPPSLPAMAAPLRLIPPAPNANLPGTPSQAAEQFAIATADALTITSEIGAAAADIGSAMAEAAVQASAPAVEVAAPAEALQATAQSAEVQAPAEPAQSAAAPAPAAAAFEQSFEQSFEQAVDSALADEVPPLAHTPLARALEELAPTPAAVLHPLASTVPLDAAATLELPAVTPLEHTAPPPAQSTRGPRASRKK